MLDAVPTHPDSVIARLDPRVRVAAAALVSALVAVLSRWEAVAGAGLLSATALGLARWEWNAAFRRLAAANTFLLVLWAVLPFTVAGETLFSLGPLAFSRQGACLVLLLSLRCNIILLALLALVVPMPVFTMARALQALGVPGKLVQLFFFTYRYLYVIYHEYERLWRTLKIRGFQPRTDLHTYKSLALLVGLLLVRSYDRSLRVQKAMICRGFRGRFYSLNQWRAGAKDAAFLALLVASLGLVAMLQWTPFAR